MSITLPHGLVYVPLFVSDKTATSIIDAIDSRDWQDSLRRRVQHYGWSYNYKSRRIDQQDWLGPLPDFVSPVVNELRHANIFEAPPDQVIVNEYKPGQGIAAHVDCEPCFGETIASLSLLSACTMRLRHRKDQLVYDVRLEPRSLLVLRDEARYKWTHEIAARKSDVVDGCKSPRERRISLTFRTVISTQ